VDHLFEDTSGKPSPRLLVDGLPWWKVVCQHTQGSPSEYYPPQGVEDLSKVIGALRGILASSKQKFNKSFDYLMESRSKVGVSECFPAWRLHELREAGPGSDIALVASIPSSGCQHLETVFHAVFHNNEVNLMKWRDLDSSRNNLRLLAPSEWFKLRGLQVQLFRAVATIGVQGSCP
jgi:hypothetical protein